MRTFLVPAVAALAAATLALPARADLFELEWSYRWSWGTVQHHQGLPDLDPSAGRTFYADAVGAYDFTAHGGPDILGVSFVGRGGDLILETLPGCPGDGCTGQRAIFDLGAARLGEGDTSTYRLEVLLPILSGSPVPLDMAWGGMELSGTVYGSGGEVYGALQSPPSTSNTWLGSPVPEPAPMALAALGTGLALAGVRRHRR
jgi:hypothetical protein